MFARTERLLLRPGWLEDAPALAQAIGEEAVVRNLARAPWPYGEEQAQAYLSQPGRSNSLSVRANMFSNSQCLSPWRQMVTL